MASIHREPSRGPPALVEVPAGGGGGLKQPFLAVSRTGSETTSSSYASHSPTVASSSADAHSVELRLATFEDKYRIEAGPSGVLGRGHHASVRACVDRSTGKRYAVKTVRKSDPSSDPTNLRREVQLLGEVEHDRVLEVVDVCEDRDRLRIVTELYSGGELCDEIVRRKKQGDGRFAEPEAARILKQVLEAVAYLHSRSIVHRDVKPENVLFASSDVASSDVRLVDFGLARKHYRDSFEPHMSTVVGTSSFLAPEVLRRKYDRSCDLWSVGVVAYLLLSGRLPFRGKTNEEVFEAVRGGKVRYPAEEWGTTSPEGRDFVAKLLKVNPKKRMTAEKALRHPWMARHGDGGEGSGGKRPAAERSRSLSGSLKLRRAKAAASFGSLRRRKPSPSA
ncbi:hypothetical protein ACHAWF_005662 [Thalassiosira exigua]